MRDAGILCVQKPNGLIFKVTVPYHVLEWFVDGYDGSGTLWSDWAEYYSIDGENRETLTREMARDLECCVTILAKSEVRTAYDHKKSIRHIELQVGGKWQRASISMLTERQRPADTP